MGRPFIEKRSCLKGLSILLPSFESALNTYNDFAGNLSRVTRAFFRWATGLDSRRFLQAVSLILIDNL
jgi:hypothetical protein